MNAQFQIKLIQYLQQKKAKNNEGFTLIELLVVVIIVGILAAVALPNLIGQIGKGREVEIKNAVGIVNRTQQSYHLENQAFAGTLATLGVTLDNNYIDNAPTMIAANGNISATVTPQNTDAKTKDRTRAYAGGIFYDTTGSGAYTQIICQSASPETELKAPKSGTECDGGSPLPN